jgi:hypothetical protein
MNFEGKIHTWIYRYIDNFDAAPSITGSIVKQRKEEAEEQQGSESEWLYES